MCVCVCVCVRVRVCVRDVCVCYACITMHVTVLCGFSMCILCVTCQCLHTGMTYAPMHVLMLVASR